MFGFVQFVTKQDFLDLSQYETSLFTSSSVNDEVKAKKEMESMNQMLPQAAKVLAGKGGIGPISSWILLFREEAGQRQIGEGILGHQWI